MGKRLNSIIDGIAKEMNNAREQIYETMEQFRTGQVLADRSPREGEQKQSQHNQMERAGQLPEQQEPEIEQER